MFIKDITERVWSINGDQTFIVQTDYGSKTISYEADPDSKKQLNKFTCEDVDVSDNFNKLYGLKRSIENFVARHSFKLEEAEIKDAKEIEILEKNEDILEELEKLNYSDKERDLLCFKRILEKIDKNIRILKEDS